MGSTKQQTVLWARGVHVSTWHRAPSLVIPTSRVELCRRGGDYEGTPVMRGAP